MPNKLNKTNGNIFDSFPNIDSILKLVSLSLVYNENEMKFYADKIPESVKNDIGSSLVISDIQGVYYRKNNSDDLYVEIEKYGNQEKFIIKKKFITNWKLTNETKIICGFECLKATTTLDIDYGDGKVFSLHPIIAWYCPNLKYSYGPKGYGGLPGTILEVEEILVIYSAIKIETNANESTDISLPKNKKIITESKMYENMGIELDNIKQNCDLQKVLP